MRVYPTLAAQDAEDAAYWAAVGLGAGFAAALVFLAPTSWVMSKLGGI